MEAVKMGIENNKKSIKTKLTLALVVAVPLVIIIATIVRVLQMRGILYGLHGSYANMGEMIGDIAISTIPTVLSLIIVVAVFMFIISRHLKSLDALKEMAHQLSNGKTNIDINAQGIEDAEISQVAAAMSDIAKSLNTLRDDFAQGEKAIGEGDITFSIKDEKMKGVFDDILNNFNNTTQEFVNCLNLFSEPLLLIDADHRLLFANETMRRFNETQGKNIKGIHINDFLNGDVAGHEYVKKTFATGKAHLETLIRLQLNPRQIFDLELNCIPVRYRGGPTKSAILLLTNLTHIKDAQRLTDKRDNYRIEQFAKLTENLTTAFSQGQLEVAMPETTGHDKDTQDIVQELTLYPAF